MSRPRLLRLPECGAVLAAALMVGLSYAAESSRSSDPESAVVRREFIFSSAAFQSCHASTIAEVNGEFVAAWFGGDREGAENVGIWLSLLTESGWSEPREVAVGLGEDGRRYPCWNPVLFQPRKGPLVLFYKVGPRPSSWWGMMMTSEDGGRTWSTPRRLPDGFLGPIKNKPLEWDDGTWICPSSEETPESPSRWSVHFERTRDGGSTWERSDAPQGAEPLDAIQPAILRTAQDRLVAVGRTRQGRVFFTASFDGGATWTPLQRTTVPNPNSGIDAVTLRDGRHLMVYNHTLRGRSPLNVAVSNDGVTWTPVLTLEDEPGEYSYPSVLQSADGLVHIVYTWKRERVRHVVLDPAKLGAGEGEPQQSNASTAGKAGNPARRPNVIIVLTDDQGYGDLSCHGNPVLWTPHIDRLSTESVRLTDFHVAPVCTPTRGQLMTGRDALKNGARTVPAASNMIWRNIPTMAELFRQGGYRTGQFGKWHLGDHYPDRPPDRGFDEAVWFGGWGVASDVEFDNDCVKIRYRQGDRIAVADRYCTDFWFDQALAWMDKCRREDRPFLCYIPTNAPHSPFWPPDAHAVAYRSKVDPQVADFFGMIANIDENMGRLENWLLETGLRDDTILIFMTDNGGTGGRRLYNAGLREAKGSYYEGGHRVPCFIRWPRGELSGGRTVSVPTQVQDILPTLLDLCDVRPTESPAFDGVSLAPVLRDPNAEFPDRMFIVQYGRRVGAEKNDGCVLWGRWRLVAGRELYDIRDDIGQKNDVSARFPDVAAKMRAYYEQWWASVEPNVHAYQPILVGTEHENPVLLSPNYWAGVDVDNHHRVSAAEGGPRGGPFHIEVTRPGRYRIELRRWPFHCNEPLGSEGPQTTVAGRALQDVIKLRRALPIRKAVLSIGSEERTADTTPEALGVSFELPLAAGRTTLQAWFQDETGTDLCGAFYVAVERLGD
ncbi:exo-alpha-sialidase [Thermopirellula anaerolimosa]